MPQTSMQHDHGRAGPVRSIPDPSTVVTHVALVIGDGQRRGSVCLELSKVVVVRFHGGPINWLLPEWLPGISLLLFVARSFHFNYMTNEQRHSGHWSLE